MHSIQFLSSLDAMKCGGSEVENIESTPKRERSRNSNIMIESNRKKAKTSNQEAEKIRNGK